jgi:osmoprotectant transport system permease protein
LDAAAAGVIEFLGDVARWFPDNMWGSPGVVNRLWEHVQISAIAVAVAAGLSIPPATMLAHRGRGGFLAVSIVNIGRAVPSFGIIALALPITIALARNVWFIDSGLGFWPTIIALVALALPPIFTNTYTGVREADSAIVEAARGMGMTDWAVLRDVKLPMAAPLILTGVRIAAVQVVATATLAALVAWGGLGRFIIDGFAGQDRVQLFAGAVLVAALAVATELAFTQAERILIPRGIRLLRRRGAAAATAAAADLVAA